MSTDSARESKTEERALTVSELIADPQQAELPTAQTPGAAMIIERADTVLSNLPTHLRSEAGIFMTQCMIAANKIKPEDVNPATIPVAVMNLATIGLIPGSGTKYAWLIPYKKVCTAVVGWHGYRHLAFQNNFLASLHLDVVMMDEEFELLNDENGAHFKHVPNPERGPVNWVDIKGAFCQYHTKSGKTGFRWCNKAELSKAKRSTPMWKNEPAVACMKTAVRRAANEQWDITNVSLKKALQMEQEQELGNLNFSLTPQFDGSPALDLDAFTKPPEAEAAPDDSAQEAAAAESCPHCGGVNAHAENCPHNIDF